MPFIDVDLLISAGDYEMRYRTPGVTIHARSVDGRTVRFPASVLQRFLTHAGIVGRFRLHFDGAGRLDRIERLGA